MSRLLSFDTSTERLAIAYSDGESTLCHESEGGARASAELIPQALALLARAGCRLAQLDAIGFGRGPGAFTGLRTACSVAQGLAVGADKPVVAIDSLMLVAETVRQAAASRSIEQVVVAMDARMDEIYAAAYRLRPGREPDWEVIEPPALYTLAAYDDWFERLAGAEVPLGVVGSAGAAFGARLASHAATPLHGDGRAAALARLAAAQWAAAGGVDAAQALPVYLRDKVAQTTRDREAQRAAKGGA